MATKLGGQPVDPVRKFRFEVETIGSTFLPPGKVGFTEVSGLNLGNTEVIEYADGNDMTPRKLPGRTKFGDVTLKKGVDAGRHLSAWREIVIESLNEEPDFAGVARPDIDEDGKRTNDFRADVKITLYDRSESSGPNPGRRRAEWIVRKAWPSTLTVDPLNGMSGEVLMEECVLATERIIQTFPPRSNAGR